MTKERMTYLQNNYPLADSGEFVFDIGTNDILTRLDIELKATNGATNNKICTMADVLTSVELMDGSNPILSLAGNELMGMSAYKVGVMPQGQYSEVPADVQYIRTPVEFGRWYGDEQIALDLSKFAHVQCRVKWNLAAVNAVGATGFVSGSARLTVIAHILEGGANPSGYLSLKRHALFTTLASGIQPNPLPIDKIIRAIGIRSYKAATGQLSGISNVRLSANEDKERPVDMLVADFLDSLVSAYGQFEYKHRFHAQGTNVLYPLLKYHETCAPDVELIAVTAHYVSTGIGQGAVILFTTSTGASLAVDNTMNADVTGYLPFSLGYLGFGAYDDPSQWLQAPLYKSLRLDLTQNVAGAACSIILEQLNNY